MSCSSEERVWTSLLLCYFFPFLFAMNDDVGAIFLAKLGAAGSGAGAGAAAGSTVFGPDEKNLSMLTIFFKNPHY